jgi:hypothetical protein
LTRQSTPAEALTDVELLPLDQAQRLLIVRAQRGRRSEHRKPVGWPVL